MMHNTSVLHLASLIAAAVLLPLGVIMIGLSLRARRSTAGEHAAAPSEPVTEQAVAAVAAPRAVGAVQTAVRRPLQERPLMGTGAREAVPVPTEAAARRSRPLPVGTGESETQPLADVQRQDAANAPTAVHTAIRRALSTRFADNTPDVGDDGDLPHLDDLPELDQSNEGEKPDGADSSAERPGTPGPTHELTAERVGNALVIHSAGPWHPALRPLAEAAPVEPTTLNVVLEPGIGTAALLPHLRWAVAAVRDQGCTEVRLITPDAAGPSGFGGANAQDVANNLGVDVIAPEGTVIPVPAMSLFAVSASGGPGTWRRFRHRGRTAETLGARQPAPRWQALLETVASGAYGELSVHTVPAGLLLLPKASTRLAHDDVAYGAPVDYSRLHVLVGRLGDEAVGDEEIASVLGALPAELRHTARLVPFGPEPSRPTARGQAVADLLGAEVRMLTGAPTVADSRLRFAVLSHAMTPLWEPFAISLTYQPTRAGRVTLPSVDHWRPPMPGLAEVEPHVYQLSADWVVEVVPCGLWVRENAPTPATTARVIPFDPAGPVMIVGTPGVELSEDVWTLVFDCLDHMSESEGKGRLLLVLGTLTDAGQAAARELAQQHEMELELSRLGRLTRRATAPPDDAAVLAPIMSPVADLPESSEEPPLPDASPAAPSTDGLSPDGPSHDETSNDAPSANVSSANGPSSDAPSDRPSTDEGATPVEEAPEPTSDADAAMDPAVLLGTTGEEHPPVLPGHRSTVEERERFRQVLGDRYGTHLGALSALLAKVPALRTDDEDAAKVDFLAVRTYLSDAGVPVGRTWLNAALRGSDRHDPAVLAYTACMASGLRRLPSYRGIALVGADLSARELAVYTPGTVLTEWAFTDATTSATTTFGTNAEYLIWCATGRRTSVLADAADDQGLLFPPNTPFLVLGVRRMPGGVTRVLLRDLVRPTQPSPARSEWTPGTRDEAALQRLTAAADKRDAVDPNALAPDGRHPQPDVYVSRFPLGIDTPRA